MSRVMTFSGINRRSSALDIGSASSLVCAVPFVSAPAQATASNGTLPSWNDGIAKQAILDFVRVTTEPASPKLVLPQLKKLPT